ncbi:hypothetical protein E4T66_14640 [Sinimarinibacterium sp. CAU 1509]|uniref:hypothetical protein n=1 Tax=Sinimarinibacterium sp. CAU 1509 TaxID=2562283 RepID=UPI0010ACD762|nr:hypothetical protein [Sinimarinibacterium sp. CAU 1509]TJY58836.1 hypothetical protein E4T66_14640 [Sinimarinibacterium sp. CAU 1509]
MRMTLLLVMVASLWAGMAQAATQEEVRAAIEKATQPRAVASLESRCESDGRTQPAVNSSEPWRWLAETLAFIAALVALDVHGDQYERCELSDLGVEHNYVIRDDRSVQDPAPRPFP